MTQTKKLGRHRTTDAAAKHPPAEASGGTAVVEQHGQVLPAALLDMVGDDFGLGSSTKAEDNLVPLAKILHTQSPELKTKDPAYMEGAAFGDVVIRATGEVIPCGDEGGGLVVIPCAFEKFWDEWTPRNKGGGLVAKHRDRPANAKEHKDPQTGQSKWSMPNGNDLIECRYHYVLCNGMPLVIPFSSTGHTVSRGWNSMMQAVKNKRGDVLPSWVKRYHLGTVYRKNDAGDWYQFKVTPLGYLDPGKEEDAALYAQAKKLYQDVEAGAKVVDMSAEEADRGGSGSGGATVDDEVV